METNKSRKEWNLGKSEFIFGTPSIFLVTVEMMQMRYNAVEKDWRKIREVRVRENRHVGSISKS